MTPLTDTLRNLARRVRNLSRGGVFKLAGGAATGQAIGLAAYPIITRLYTPSELGVLTVYVSTVGILAVIGCLRFEQAIPLPREDKDALALVVLSWLVSIGVSALVLIAVALQPGWFPGSEDDAPALVSYLVPVGVFAIATYNTLNMLALRERMYGEVARTRVVQGASLAAIQVGGGLVSGGPTALVAGHLGGNSAGAARLFIKTLARHAENLRTLEGSRIKRAFRRYVKFMFVGAPSALLNATGLLLGPILIAQYYGVDNAGYFGIATTALSVPVRLVGTSNAQVFYAESSRIVHNDPGAVKTQLSRTTLKLLALGIIPAGLLLLFGPQIFGFVFGDPWVEGGRFTSILVTAYFLAVISAPAAQTFLLVERQEISLILNTFKAAAPIIGFLVLPLAGAGVGAATITFSVTLSLYYISVIILALAVLARHGPARR